MFNEALSCAQCGYEFDPIRYRWLCPQCKLKTPCCDGAPLPLIELPIVNPYDAHYSFCELVVCYDDPMSTAAAIDEDDLLSSSEMARLKGMTKSRLDRWVTQGFLKPVIVGGNRMFTQHDRHIVQVMVAMIDAGIGVEAAHRAAMNQGWLSENVQVVIGSRSQRRQWKALQSVL
jgi:hypothetical protein